MRLIYIVMVILIIFTIRAKIQKLKLNFDYF